MKKVKTKGNNGSEIRNRKGEENSEKEEGKRKGRRKKIIRVGSEIEGWKRTKKEEEGKGKGK